MLILLVDDEDDIEYNEEDDDDEEGTSDEEEGVVDEEYELAADKGEAVVHGMNSPLRLNKNIRFSFTCSSTAYVDDVVQHGSTPPQVETADPLIQDVISPRSVSPYHQAEPTPPMPTPLRIVSFYQGESNSNFQTDTIVVVEQESNILDTNATNDDQPIHEASDQSKTGDYERVLDMGYMAQAVVSLLVVYPDSHFEGEITQGRI
ncbi:unnamed protein product [Lactuca saligna]|uniref:Uncharacterized protein n=1 Tax=Lactuca saligna TaxID=75948 RepID=A0AA35Y8T7_LACSI|nr:unnamed protein product [Lactuca saligna]